jgi:hypothetical protein
MMRAEIKGVRIANFMSEETIAFTGTLYIDGKKAAALKNEGRGGNNHMWFEDRALEKAFRTYCESLPPLDSDWGALPMCADLWISMEIDRINDATYWKRQCRKNTIVRLTTDPDGKYREFKGKAFTTQFAKALRDKYGHTLVEILNERYC